MRILIATATAGGGHLQAAAALEEAWTALRPKDEVRRLDILEFTPKLYRKAYSEGYVKLAEKSPELYAHAFRKTDNPVLVRKATRFRRLTARWVARKFVKWVDVFKPDLVLCPHFLPMETLGSVRGHAGHHQPKIFTIVTDFEAHALWMEPSVDAYFVAMPQTKARLVARGIPASRVFVTGIPVSKRFEKLLPAAPLRRRFGLREKVPTVLVLGGGMGMGPMAETLKQLDKTSRPVQFLAVAGKNEALQKALKRLRLSHPIKIFGFVTNMEQLMAVADVIVTKPGGLTTSEALAVGKPLLIVNPLPGQEAANSDFLLEHGAAVKANRLEDLSFRMESLLKPGMLRRMSRSALALGRPQAAPDICRQVVRLFKS